MIRLRRVAKENEGPWIVHRGLKGDWPIQLQVSKENADTWMKYLSAACTQRGWELRGFAEQRQKEARGIIKIVKQTAVLSTLRWERKRPGTMSVRGRSEVPSELPLSDLQALCERVTERCAAQEAQEFFHWACIEYHGLPWRGELWLENMLRLGPPTKGNETTTISPRAVLVSALVKGVDRTDAWYVFEKSLRELCAFLSVIMATHVGYPHQARAWTWKIGTDGTPMSEVRNLGYLEEHEPSQMPAPGTYPLPLYPVTRPHEVTRGTRLIDTEIALPGDVLDLWGNYRALEDRQRSKFLQAAAKWQEALLHWEDRSTLSFALMVVACEALKPSDRQFNDHKIDDLVEALLGASTAAHLKQDWFRAHHVRSVHLHLGEFRGLEFDLLHRPGRFYDPTFDLARDELFKITNAAIIEWLRRRGTFTLPLVIRPMTIRRWMRKNVSFLLPIVLVIGIVLGWTFGVIWY
jgi:hypothetical protein